METEKYKKVYCGNCGKWLGVKKDGVDLSGFYPYCPKCRKQVWVTEVKATNLYRKK